MYNKRREKEEYLEKLWEMKELGQAGMHDLRLAMDGNFEGEVIGEMTREGLVEVNGENQIIALTEKGETQARKIIRAHRIGERLLYDVFGGEFEAAACELEHMNSLEIVDSICTLLGHPRQCPHGKPIPAGECCRHSAKTSQNLVVPLRELEIGQSARVAYINCGDDGQMHRLFGLQIRPGIMIKLHQRYPCCVVECEDASIALDDEIASSICVWANTPQYQPEIKTPVKLQGNHGRRWRRYFSFGCKKKQR
ncbi:MAG: metal-dependent transcriptional regulator [Proteobacteria bacterium]|nr:metal-dependent transcriptional regulator [Pseudomonadota bacterium]